MFSSLKYLRTKNAILVYYDHAGFLLDHPARNMGEAWTPDEDIATLESNIKDGAASRSELTP